jgi:hypothetical protein
MASTPDHYRIYFSATPSMALTTTYVGGALGTDASIPKAQALFPQMHLSLVNLRLVSIAGGATKVTWYIASDAGGDRPITPEQEDLIVDPDTDGVGGVNRTLGIIWNTLMGDLYVFAKLDAGTATGQALLSWNRFTDDRLEE